MNYTKNNLRLLLIDDDPEIQKDFIKIMSETQNKNHQLEILGTQIFGENYKHNSSAKINFPTFEIVVTSQGLEAIEILKQSLQQKLQFAIAFVDLRMPPGIDGLETIKSIWKIDKDIQIVICITLSDCNWQEKINDLEAEDNLLILKKPFDYITLRQLACTLSKKWLLTQESKNYSSIIENYVQERTESLVYQANHDPLTEIGNRNALLIELDHLIQLADHNNSIFAVLYLDLDNFKYINDTYSHETGDEILKTLAKRIKNNVRKQDHLFRVGGDEFVMLTSDLKHEINVNNIATNLLKIIQEPIKINNITINAKSSIGICLYPKHGKELLHKADLAMYEAKKLGGDQFVIFSENMYNSINEINIKIQLQQALKNNELLLYYFPLIDLDTEKLVAIEALIKWQHPKLGILPYNGFMHNIENSEIGIIINDWIIKTSISQNKLLHTRGYDFLTVSVNMELYQINQKNLAQKISCYLQEFDLEPKYFGIEISENILLNNPEILNIIIHLKKLGINVTINHFGSGNMSLGYLKKLPVDYLKIDRSLISNIEIDNNHKIILESIIKHANNLNCKVISVGIETIHHKNFFQQHNYQFSEGYYLTQPLLLEDLEKLLTNNHQEKF